MNRRPAPWLFLIGTIAWTWCFLFLTLLTGQGYLQFPTVILTLIGGLGPLLVPTLLIRLGYWDASLDETPGGFLRRMINPLTLSFRWFVYVVGLVLVLRLVPILLNQAFGGHNAGILEVGPWTFIFIGVVFGGLEEFGWRGYAQEALQRRLPIVLAGFVIGAFWAAWHFPLFFMEGSYQAQMGLFTSTFWLYHASIVIGSPIYAWLYNACGRVAFVAVFYHALGNLGGELFADADPWRFFVELMLLLVVIVGSWRWIRRPVGKSDPAV